MVHVGRSGNAHGVLSKIGRRVVGNMGTVGWWIVATVVCVLVVVVLLCHKAVGHRVPEFRGL